MDSDSSEKKNGFFKRFGKTLDEKMTKLEEKLDEKISEIEKDIDDKKGVAGGIADGMDKLAREIDKIDEKIQAKGGLGQMTKDAYNKTKDTLDKTLSDMEPKYNDLKEKLFTNGVYDPDKAKIVLKDTAAVMKTYGKQGGEYLINLSIKMSRKVGEIILPHWTSIRPTPEDLQEGGKYYMLGSKLSGKFLFTENYENTVKFRDFAKDKIPDNKAFGRKDEILEDIWVSASGNASDLLKYYTQLKNIDSIGSHIAKSTVVGKYLTKK